MRVISGTARGKKLIAPEGINTRPTTDRVKESIFNIIQRYIPCENVLDAFAGSGALGIEALSRGAESCTFIETNPEALNILRKNVDGAKVSDKSEILRKDIFDFLKLTNKKFDIIFLDPPYNKGFLSPVFKIVKERKLLSENGIVLVETEFGGEETEFMGFDCIKQAKYGKTQVSVFTEMI